MYRWKLQTVDSCRIESKIPNRKFYSLFLLVLYFSLGFCFLSLLTDVASYIKSARISWIKAVVLYWLDVENTYLIDYFNPLKNYRRNPLSAYESRHCKYVPTYILKEMNFEFCFDKILYFNRFHWQNQGLTQFSVVCWNADACQRWLHIGPHVTLNHTCNSWSALRGG